MISQTTKPNSDSPESIQNPPLNKQFQQELQIHANSTKDSWDLAFIRERRALLSEIFNRQSKAVKIIQAPEAIIPQAKQKLSTDIDIRPRKVQKTGLIIFEIPYSFEIS